MLQRNLDGSARLPAPGAWWAIAPRAEPALHVEEPGA